MNFNGLCSKLFPVPMAHLESLRDALARTDLTAIATYKDYYESDSEGWVRSENALDKNPVLDLPGARDVLQVVQANLPDHRVLIFGVSRLNAKQRVFAHSDHMFMHRFQLRMLIPITYNDACVNRWLTDKGWVDVKLEPGWAYNFNDAVVHESLNEGAEHRDMLKLHLISRRLEGKFSRHPDWLAPIGKSKNDEHVNSVKNLTRIAQGKRL